MFTPSSFREDDPSVLREFMQTYSFATLFSWTEDGPMATHLPFMVEDGGQHGTLVGHMARANPQWRSFAPDREVLVAFVGPHAYISPLWYSSPTTVPTWNYAAVHAYGRPRIVNEEAALMDDVLRLSALHESHSERRWDPEMASPPVSTLLKALVGFEIPIDRIEGTFKFNQNRSRADRAGVVAALEHSPNQVDREVAAIMRSQLEATTS